MPRPKSMTLAQIAAAALAVVERDGLENLSMRTVAAELEVGAMSLYRYVDSREALEDLVVGLVYDEVDTSTPSGSWNARVTTLVERMRATVARRSAVLPLAIRRGHGARGWLRWLESLLGVLDEAGFDGVERAVAVRALGAYVIGAIQLEHFAPLTRRSRDFAELSREEFPLLLDTAKHAQKIAGDAEFRRGLALLLRGMGDIVRK